MADDDLKRLFDAARQENAAAHTQTRRQFEETANRLSAENRRYFDIATEATKNEIRLVADTVAHVHEELKRTRTALDEKVEHTANETQP